MTNTTTDGRLDDSTKYRLLADERRRAVLDVLAAENGAVDLDDLVDEIVSRVDQVDDTRQTKVALHHTHLPLMDEAGVVDYAPASNQIAPGHVSFDHLFE